MRSGKYNMLPSRLNSLKLFQIINSTVHGFLSGSEIQQGSTKTSENKVIF